MLFALAINVGVFLAFGIPTFTANDNLIGSSILILSFWLCSASFVYLIEGAFNEPSMGQLLVLCANTLIGLVTLLVSLILQSFWWLKVDTVR